MNRNWWWIPTGLCLLSAWATIYVAPIQEVIYLILGLVLAAVLCAFLALGIGRLR